MYTGKKKKSWANCRRWLCHVPDNRPNFSAVKLWVVKWNRVFVSVSNQLYFLHTYWVPFLFIFFFGGGGGHLNRIFFAKFFSLVINFDKYEVLPVCLHAPEVGKSSGKNRYKPKRRANLSSSEVVFPGPGAPTLVDQTVYNLPFLVLRHQVTLFEVIEPTQLLPEWPSKYPGRKPAWLKDIIQVAEQAICLAWICNKKERIREGREKLSSCPTQNSNPMEFGAILVAKAAPTVAKQPHCGLALHCEVVCCNTNCTGSCWRTLSCLLAR